jgi:hypothetical protein
MVTCSSIVEISAEKSTDISMGLARAALSAGFGAASLAVFADDMRGAGLRVGSAGCSFVRVQHCSVG